MKFHITRSGKKIKSKSQENKRIVFAGRNTLRIIKQLPTISQQKTITVSHQKSETKKHRTRKYSLNINKLFIGIKRIIKEIAKELLFAYKRLVRLVEKYLERPRKTRKHDRSPFMLMGAACASVLATTLVSAFIFLSIFADRARGYELITIPSFIGVSPEETEFDRDTINIIIKYENNPDIEDGAVISQSPRAGVTRRIYNNGDFCDVHLTVSRHEHIAVPDGIVGYSLRDATLTLMNSGLRYEVKEKFSLGTKDGIVLSSYPKSGEMIKVGEKVILTVSG